MLLPVIPVFYSGFSLLFHTSRDSELIRKKQFCEIQKNHIKPFEKLHILNEQCLRFSLHLPSRAFRTQVVTSRMGMHSSDSTLCGPLNLSSFTADPREIHKTSHGDILMSPFYFFAIVPHCNEFVSVH